MKEIRRKSSILDILKVIFSYRTTAVFKITIVSLMLNICFIFVGFALYSYDEAEIEDSFITDYEYIHAITKSNSTSFTETETSYYKEMFPDLKFVTRHSTNKNPYNDYDTDIFFKESGATGLIEGADFEYLGLDFVLGSLYNEDFTNTGEDLPLIEIVVTKTFAINYIDNLNKFLIENNDLTEPVYQYNQILNNYFQVILYGRLVNISIVGVVSDNSDYYHQDKTYNNTELNILDNNSKYFYNTFFVPEGFIEYIKNDEIFDIVDSENNVETETDQMIVLFNDNESSNREFLEYDDNGDYINLYAFSDAFDESTKNNLNLKIFTLILSIILLPISIISSTNLYIKALKNDKEFVDKKLEKNSLVLFSKYLFLLFIILLIAVIISIIICLLIINITTTKYKFDILILDPFKLLPYMMSSIAFITICSISYLIFKNKIIYDKLKTGEKNE